MKGRDCLNIGLIGFGNMGKTHAYAVSNLKYYYDSLPFDAKITGLCTRHPGKASEFTEKYSLGRVYENEDELIGDKSVDIVDICTPNIYHYETLKKAIAAGKHIYCEKPLCVTAAQSAEIASLAKDAGICAQVVFNTRFLLPVIRAKELIDEGALGDIISFRAAFHHSSATDPHRPAGWKQDKNICGGGVLFDLGSHVIDMIAYLCGQFDWVSGASKIAFPTRIGTDGKEWTTNADEAFYMMCALKCDALGTIEVGKIQLGTNDDFSFEIFGTRGAVKFDLMNPNWLYFYDNTVRDAVKGFTRIECVGRYPEGSFPGAKAPVGWLRGHVGSMHAFLSSVYSGTPASPSFIEAAHVQSVMESAYRSDTTGCRENVAGI